MIAFTAGPWRFTGPDDGVIQIWGASTAGEVAAIENPWMDEAEKIANAHLIIAGPDLFEACEALTEWCEYHAPSGNGLGDVMHRAYEAIAKATGGAS